MRLERMGMALISLEAGLDALRTALSTPHAVLAAVPIRWQRFLAAGRKPLPQLYAEFAPALAAATAGPASAGQAVAIDMAALETKVQEAVAQILGAPVPVSEPLMAAGLDSLGSVELRNLLEGSLGTQLPGTLVFDYPTVGSLTEFLGQTLGGTTTAAAAEAPLILSSNMFGPAGTSLAPVAGATGSPVVMVGTAWRCPQEGLACTVPLDAIGLVPLERWDVEAEPLAARFGAYFTGIAAFDASAFGVPDSEAALVDPQQRLLLETMGEALVAYPADVPHKARAVYVGEPSWQHALLGHALEWAAAASYPRDRLCLRGAWPTLLPSGGCVQALRPLTTARWSPRASTAAPIMRPPMPSRSHAGVSATRLACAAPA